LSASGTKAVRTWLVAAIATAATGVAVWFYLPQWTDPGLPDLDLSQMEPGVSAMIRDYSKSVRSAPADPEPWARLAQALHAHDLFPQAITVYAKAMELQHDDWRWPYLAALAMTKSDPQASLPLFRRAIEQDPASVALYINFGDTLIRSGRLAEAEAAFHEAQSLDENSSHARYGLAQLALARDDAAAALVLLEQAAAISPRHGEVYALSAQAHQRLGNEEQARRQAMFASAWPGTTRAPDPVVHEMELLAVNSQSIARAGVRLAQRGQYAEAEDKFREVLGIRPGNARDYANLGGALAGQGRVDEALAAYRDGLDIDPSDVDNLNNLGFTLLQMERYDDARVYLQKALEIDPVFAAALGNLGLLAARQQDPAAANEYLQQALQINPGLLFVRSALAAQMATSGKLAEAIAQWQLVLEMNPHELAAIYNVAVAEAARGEHGNAIAHLRSGLEIAPNSSRLVAALAWQLSTALDDELRDGAEAMQLAMRVYQAFSNQPQMIDIMAAALAETGDYDNAVVLMERIAAIDNAAAERYALRLAAYRKSKPWRQFPSTSVNASALIQDR